MHAPTVLFLVLFSWILIERFFNMRLTLDDLKRAKGSGASRVYERPRDAVWEAALESVGALGLILVSKGEGKDGFHARSGMSAFSWGENVGVFFEDSGSDSQTRVEVASKRAVIANLTARNWERPILEYLDEHLATRPAG